MLPERIVFCIDTSQEADSLSGHTQTKLAAIKEKLKKFIWQKRIANSQHEFAIATFTCTTFWHCEFGMTSGQVMESVDSIEVSREEVSYWDVVSLHDAVSPYAPTPHNPKYFLRVILVYFRSAQLPTLSPTKLPHNPYFIIESVYLHDRPSPDNCVQEVYDQLNEIDGNGG
ncbi:hypothetical protein HK101_003177 [Irineochytrium annulatum]|nr:hypothetical protein HK101_003177 [Irineochytrium annulatum]